VVEETLQEQKTHLQKLYQQLEYEKMYWLVKAHQQLHHRSHLVL